MNEEIKMRKKIVFRARKCQNSSIYSSECEPSSIGIYPSDVHQPISSEILKKM